MKTIRMKGKTVDEAIEAALKVGSASREDAKINVIKEGKPGILGMLGGEEAEIEANIREGEEADAKQILQEILDKMGFIAVVEAKKEDEAIELKIKGDDMGRIIGKEGSTIVALEILVRAIIMRAYEKKISISIDAADYKEKRRKSLERLASEIAEEVEKTKKEKEMPFLSAADRRVVHLFLKDSRKVSTYSIGEGKGRKLIIKPKE